MPTLTPRERIGTTVGGRYAIKRLIGEGGFSAVFEAVHDITGAHVALKILHPHLVTTEQITERFLMEARAMARIRHEGIVRVLDAGKDPDGAIFIALELLEGEPLELTLARVGRLTWDETVTIGVGVLGALAEAHRNGIVHRDIKPGNIFITQNPDGACQARLLDFGIAQVAQPSGGKLTQQGMILGTPEYMSPEQSRSGLIGPESDVWSVGIVMFECLTGVTPFMSESTTEILLKVASTDAPSVLEFDSAIPWSIAQVVDKALAREIVNRHRSAEAMREELLRARSLADSERQRGPTARGTPIPGGRRPPPETLNAPVVASVAPLPVISGGSLPELGNTPSQGREASTERLSREPSPPRRPREVSSRRERDSGPPREPSNARDSVTPREPSNPRESTFGRETATLPGESVAPREPEPTGFSPLRGPTPAPLGAGSGSLPGVGGQGLSALRGPTPAPVGRTVGALPGNGGRGSQEPARSSASSPGVVSQSVSPAGLAVPSVLADSSAALDTGKDSALDQSSEPAQEPPRSSSSGVRFRDASASRSGAYSPLVQELPAFQAPPASPVPRVAVVVGVGALLVLGAIVAAYSGSGEAPSDPVTERPVTAVPEDPDPTPPDATVAPPEPSVQLSEQRAIGLPSGFTGADNAAEFARHTAVSPSPVGGATQRVVTTCIPAPDGARVYLYSLGGVASLGSSLGTAACAGYDLGVVTDITGDGTDDVVAVEPERHRVVFLDSRTMQPFRSARLEGAHGVVTGLVLRGEPVALVYAEANGSGAATSVSAVSLTSTERLWVVAGAGALARVGEPGEVGLAVGPDLTGDGVQDVVIGMVPVIGASAGSVPARSRCVQAYSGSNGAPVWPAPFCQQRSGGSQSVSLGPDLDGDGRGEVLVGTDRPMGDDPPVVLLSGATGRMIRSVVAPSGDAASGFGWPVVLGGDVDGNGTPDMLVGSVGSGTYATLFEATSGRAVTRLQLGGVGSGNLRFFLVPSLVPRAPWNVLVADPAGGIRLYARASGGEG